MEPCTTDSWTKLKKLLALVGKLTSEHELRHLLNYCSSLMKSTRRRLWCQVFSVTIEVFSLNTRMRRFPYRETRTRHCYPGLNLCNVTRNRGPYPQSWIFSQVPLLIFLNVTTPFLRCQGHYRGPVPPSPLTYFGSRILSFPISLKYTRSVL